MIEFEACIVQPHQLLSFQLMQCMSVYYVLDKCNEKEAPSEEVNLFKFLFLPGSGLNCYQCNSYEHALCADPFFHEPTNEGDLVGPPKSGSDFLLPCPADTADKKHFCRKIYQNG